MNGIGYIQFTFPDFPLFSSSRKKDDTYNPERSQQIFDVKNAALFLTNGVTASLHKNNGNAYEGGARILKRIGFKNVKKKPNAKYGDFAIRFFFPTEASLMGVQCERIPLSRMTVVSLHGKTQANKKALGKMCERAGKITTEVQAGKITSISLNYNTLDTDAKAKNEYGLPPGCTSFTQKNSIASVDDAKENEFTETPKERQERLQKSEQERHTKKTYKELQRSYYKELKPYRKLENASDSDQGAQVDNDGEIAERIDAITNCLNQLKNINHDLCDDNTRDKIAALILQIGKVIAGAFYRQKHYWLKQVLVKKRPEHNVESRKYTHAKGKTHEKCYGCGASPINLVVLKVPKGSRPLDEEGNPLPLNEVFALNSGEQIFRINSGNLKLLS